MSEEVIERVAVIGAGRMGTGIAQVCAMTGIPTTLVDRDPAAAERAHRTIQSALDRAVERERLSAGDRDRAVASLALGSLDDLGAIDLAIEAVPEEFDTKARLLAELADKAPRARAATNTRTLSVTELGRAAGRRELVGLHFVNPVPRTRVLEVVCDDAAWPALNELAMRLGKIAIRTADSPGFLVDRVSQPLALEAGRMRAEGLADTAQLDDCLSTALGAPVGPFEQIDLDGTDVAAAHARRLWRALGEPARLAPDPQVAELAAAGQLGRRSGRGFYTYPRPAPQPPEAVNEVGPFMELLAQVCPIATTDGRTAAERAGPDGLALVDIAPAPFMARPSLAFASAGLDGRTKQELHTTAGHEGIALVEVPDTPGLLALRAVSAIVNEAGCAAADGVAGLNDIDRALQLGLSWTVGPKRLLKWFAPAIQRTLQALEARAGDGRYTPAPGLF
jgi:3-hydroxybutyryl-CoA dehydrogenase